MRSYKFLEYVQDLSRKIWQPKQCDMLGRLPNLDHSTNVKISPDHSSIIHIGHPSVFRLMVANNLFWQDIQRHRYAEKPETQSRQLNRS